MFRKHDIVWSMMKSQQALEKFVPTWAAYNSLLTENLQTISKFSSLPVMNGSPTDCPNHYTALKIVQNINITCTPQKYTIFSLDVQLYTKCIELQSKTEISNKFLFCLGELHVVFAMLKVLGKYINNSGLDQAFAEAEIYGLATIEQIKHGKHMERSFEVNTT